MPGGRQAAVRHFPEHELIIGSKCNFDEEFRSLCDDLWEAELVLVKLEKSTLPAQDERLEEYRALVEGLLAEIAAAIGVGNVLRFQRRPERD